MRSRAEVHHIIDDGVCATTPLEFQGEVLHRRSVDKQRRLQELCGHDRGLAAFRSTQRGIGRFSFAATLIMSRGRCSRPSTWILRRWTREHELQKHIAPCRGHSLSSNSRPTVLRPPLGGEKFVTCILACLCQRFAGGSLRQRRQAPIPHFDTKNTGQGRHPRHARTAKVVRQYSLGRRCGNEHSRFL